MSFIFIVSCETYDHFTNRQMHFLVSSTKHHIHAFQFLRFVVTNYYQLGQWNLINSAGTLLTVLNLNL